MSVYYCETISVSAKNSLLKNFWCNFKKIGTIFLADILDKARVAELVDALVLGTSGVTRESSSLSFRTIYGTPQCNCLNELRAK